MMNNIEKIENKILDSNITLVLHKYNTLKAFTVKVGDDYAIGCNPSLFDDKKELHTALAHEYYHCEGGYTYNEKSSIEQRAKQEYKTNFYMALEMLPPSVLKPLLEKATPIYEIADFFELTEEFINTTILIYKSKGLI